MRDAPRRSPGAAAHLTAPDQVSRVRLRGAFVDARRVPLARAPGVPLPLVGRIASPTNWVDARGPAVDLRHVEPSFGRDVQRCDVERDYVSLDLASFRHGHPPPDRRFASSQSDRATPEPPEALPVRRVSVRRSSSHRRAGGVKVYRCRSLEVPARIGMPGLRAARAPGLAEDPVSPTAPPSIAPAGNRVQTRAVLHSSDGRGASRCRHEGRRGSQASAGDLASAPEGVNQS